MDKKKSSKHNFFMLDLIMRSFLSLFSKEELIELLLTESQSNEELKKSLKKRKEVFEYLKKANHDIRKINTLEDASSIFPTTKNEKITRTSSPTEKIKLFMNLFKGRQDIFALRWENEKTNQSGYSPVCKNKWNKAKCDMKKYPCKVCPYKELEILSEKYIYNHLAGKDELCRDVIGLYPLLKDDTCYFLALDFDEKTWKDDIKSVKQICNQYEIPTNIEISRSGNGAHLWIFFSEAIASAKVRTLGTLLLQSSMNINHSLKISSFDRMFPNQDFLPKGGYGNLIALPLQGKAVKNKKSVFVNGAFEPFDDQWEYLSSIRQISKNELEKIIQKILDNTVLPEKITTTKKKVISALKSENIIENFPKHAKLILKNQIIIKKKDFSEQILNQLKQTAVFQNPEFYKKQNMRLLIYNIPRFIDCSEEDEENLYLPRGNLFEIKDFFDKNNCELIMKDNRNLGNEIDVTFEKKLYPEQKDALSELLKNDMGLLSAGTGFGKTIVTLALIAKRKISTLIIVNTSALLEQWKKSIEEFLNIKPGSFNSGKNKLSGIIDVALIQSLIEKKTGIVKKIEQTYGMIIIDECHHISAFSYEKVIKSFDSKFVYGLTATPIRRDGLEKIIFMQCGKILYSTTAKEMNKKQNFSHYLIPRFTTFHKIQKTSEEKSINGYYSELVENEARNDLIVSDIKKTIELGKTPLILSDRVSHLELIKEKIKDFAQNVFLISGKGTVKHKKEVLDKIANVPAIESMIILATGKYVGEGFDNPRLDTLFLIMPFSWKGTLSQYCGRIHRNYEGKNEVLIFDYIDICVPVFDKMYQKRLKGYKQLEYKIKTSIHAEENKKDSEFSIFKEEAILFSFEESVNIFNKDIQSAQESIYISATSIKMSSLYQFAALIKKKITEGVKINLLIKEKIETKKDFSIMGNVGINCIIKDNLSQNLVIIDEKILWYGSTTHLGFSDDTDCFLRIVNAKIASKLENDVFLKGSLNLKHLFTFPKFSKEIFPR